GLGALAPGRSGLVTVSYAPTDTARGGAQLVVDSNDADRPMLVVPLAGRPDDLPPIAVAGFDGPAPSPIEPGTRVAVTSAGSIDPEGSALTFAWRFVVRPEGSRARFEDASAAATAFTIDLPGTYVAGLEARDGSNLASTNDAKVEVVATAGRRVRVELSWDRPEVDLDLHLVSPGAPVGSLGDCFFDNPSPDFAPPGPAGDPAFEARDSAEVIAMSDPGDGVYTIAVAVVAPSPRGATTARLAMFLGDVEAAVFEASLPASADGWDVATLTWPSGRLTPLGTIH
ncbi:hypothetical protein L6R52_34115, partial [Myxococcota bacterium]|nr:hypothetical protein [Myxococcota bacterium]